MNFEFASAQRIIFGPRTIDQLPELAQGLGRRALLLTGADPKRIRPWVDALIDADLLAAQTAVNKEPDIAAVQDITNTARSAQADLIIAIGGGSVMDAGKAVAALLANGGDVLDYLEVVGKGKPLQQPSVPCIAVPTTAGTGAEVTRNAVLAVPATDARPGQKVSLRSAYMLPSLALIDPALTQSMPPTVTASTGMDALTQCLEPYLARQATPITDAIAREGLTHAARALQRACANGDDIEARTAMALAGLCGGMALANAKLGAVHGFAGVIGGMFPAPHGAICARLLPPVFAANLQAVSARGTADQIGRFHTLAQILTGDQKAEAPDAVAWLNALVDELPISRLREFGMESRHFGAIITAAQKSSSMQGNPVELTDMECRAILEQAL